jgi:FG-GAP-like repeat
MKRLLVPACVALALACFAAGSSAAGGSVPSFAAAKRYKVTAVEGCGSCAVSTAIGDLDGDVRPDVVTVNGDQTISVFITKADGTLGSRRDYLASGDPAGAAISDLNGDAHPDVAVADRGGFLTVFLNTGDGTLGTKHDYAAGTGAASIAAGDVDGDGSADLVTAGSGGVSVLHNDGNGSFGARDDYSAGGASVALGDLNGDGKVDVVVAGGDDVSVLFNNGGGSFETPRHYAADGAVSVALGDLNGDGKSDVATADNGPGVSVLLNAGDGTLRRRRIYEVLHPANMSVGDSQSIAIADLNGDHRADLATANFDRHVSLLLNDGAGAFHTTIDIGTGSCREVFENDRGIAAGELNGDGRADLAVASTGGVCVSLAKPGLCNVQDVVGLKLPEARKLLARAHCRVGTVRRKHSELFRKGQISVERPGFGRALRAGARVGLVVSLGPR